jgi:NUMOD4 motif/HNH endonuclease
MHTSTGTPTIEQWLPIPGFNGIYEVSSEGRIRSLNRRNSRGYLTQGREMTPHLQPNGYMMITLSFGSTRKRDYVHRIVLEAFCGPCPPGWAGAHSNGNRSDNRLVNLRWATNVDNHADKLHHGTLLRGEQLPQSKLTEQRVRELRASSMSLAHFSLLWGISEQILSRARKGINWKHIK